MVSDSLEGERGQRKDETEESSLDGPLDAVGETDDNERLSFILFWKDPHTPRLAKVYTVLVVSYAFSPIDRIPDWIPVWGYLDDRIRIPASAAVTLKRSQGGSGVVPDEGEGISVPERPPSARIAAWLFGWCMGIENAPLPSRLERGISVRDLLPRLYDVYVGEAGGMPAFSCRCFDSGPLDFPPASVGSDKYSGSRFPVHPDSNESTKS